MSVSAVLCVADVILWHLRDPMESPAAGGFVETWMFDEICHLAKASTVIFLEDVKRVSFSPFLLLPLAINSTVLT